MKGKLPSATAIALTLAFAQPALGEEPSAGPPPSAAGPRAIQPAEEPWLRDASREGHAPLFSDPLASTAVADLVLGGVLLVIGAPLWGAATTSEHVCGKLAGCFESNEIDEPARDGGASLTGLGLGFAVTGGVALAVIAANPKDLRAERERSGLATAGLLFAGLSLGSLIGGVTLGVMLDDNGVSDPYENSWALFTTSGLAAAIGLPFLISGAPFASVETKTKRRLHGHTELFNPVPRSIMAGPAGISATWGF
jgi:hypothetical protein